MKRHILKLLLKISGAAGSVAGFLTRYSGARFKSSMASSIDRIIFSIPHKAYILLYPLLFMWFKKMSSQGPILVNHEIKPGLKMNLDVSQKTQRQIWLSRPYEKAITRFIEKNLGIGDIFIDVGANVGYYSLLGALLVGKEGRVLAFEPEIQNFSMLASNIALNGFKNISVFKAALGSKEGRGVLYLNPLNEGGHSMNEITEYHDSGLVVSREKIAEKFEVANLSQQVEMLQLSSVVSSFPEIRRVKIIKIDVEGFEEEVIGGMSELLKEKRVDYIICEISDTTSPVVSLMFNNGYATHEIGEDGNISVLKGPLQPGHNYLFKSHE